MKINQFTIANMSDLRPMVQSVNNKTIGLYFGSNKKIQELNQSGVLNGVSFPVIGCSTSGEISQDGVSEDSLVFNLCEFEKDVTFKADWCEITSDQSLHDLGRELGEKVKIDDAKLVLVFGIGVNVNGSELVRGFRDVFSIDIPVTGGLAGDDANFIETFVGLNSEISNKKVIALCIGGEDLRIGFGSRGGWQPFGPERKITRADNNILYEIDGESALEIYKTYLGDKVNELPGSGLLYPLAVQEPGSDDSLIRTILGINEKDGSLVLAGEVKEGATLKLMHAGTDGLIEGAEEAADLAGAEKTQNPGFAILVSCVGRKIVMGSDVEDEVDAVKEHLGNGTVVTGFYSHGEICPSKKGKPSELHNQTMTITYLSEAS